MPAISLFLSAASDDLRAWRGNLHRAFSRAGLMVYTQDHSLAASAGDVLRLLRQHLDKSDFVLHLAGLAYGAEPEQQPFADLLEFQCSYTQFEFYYSHLQNKPVIAFVCGTEFPYLSFQEQGTDGNDRERRRKLQLAHRERLVSGMFAGTPLEGHPTRPLSESVADPNQLLEAVSAAIGTIRDAHGQLRFAKDELTELAAKHHDQLLNQINGLPKRIAAEIGQLWRPQTIGPASRSLDGANSRLDHSGASSGPAIHNERIQTFLRRQQAVGPLPAPFQLDRWRIWLDNVYQLEVSHALANAKSLSKRNSQQRARAEQDPSFLKLAGSHCLVSQADLELSSTERLGLNLDTSALKKILTLKPRLGFAVSPAHAGTMAILYYLKFVKGYPIDIIIRFPHSVEMAKQAMNNTFVVPIHGVTLTIATAAFLLGQSNGACFMPHLVLPGMSHGIVAPDGDAAAADELRSGCYFFMNDPPGSECFLFEDMLRGGQLAETAVGRENIEPDDTTLALAEKQRGLKAIIGFPHYHFQTAFNHCRLLNDPFAPTASKDVILFLRRDILQDRRISQAISMVIRDAWFTLKEQPELRTSLVSLLLQDRDYLRLIIRCSGMHHLYLHELGEEANGKSPSMEGGSKALEQ